jgi:hypothetical protein
MSLFKSGPNKQLALDDLTNVSGFDGVSSGSFVLKNQAGQYVPDNVTNLRQNLGLGLEYVEESGVTKLQVKVNPLISRIQLTADGLISYPNLYQINFSTKGKVNGFNLSTGDSESYSYGNYVVPLDSYILGGSCISTSNKLPVVSECLAAIIYNGMKTEMIIQKNRNDSSGLVVFDPKIFVTSGSRLGIMGITTNEPNASCTVYSIFLASLPSITNTVKVRKCTLPISVTTVTNPDLPTAIVSVGSVPMVPV